MQGQLIAAKSPSFRSTVTWHPLYERPHSCVSLKRPAMAAVVQLTKEQKREYNRLVIEAQQAEARGLVQEAIQNLEAARRIYSGDCKLAKKIDRLAASLKVQWIQVISSPNIIVWFHPCGTAMSREKMKLIFFFFFFCGFSFNLAN
jgi:hypothetical protein